MTVRDYSCVHCGKRIHTHDGTWVHIGTGSVYCDQSGTVKAAPR